jgi:hypothetical protein
LRWIVLGAVLVNASWAYAQAVSVQQPVMGTACVGTTVSVPDRGAMRLGGVNSAAAGRSSSGLPRTSNSLGWQTQGSSFSAQVFIHDLRAMDEALLATAKPVVDDPWSRRLAERRGSTVAADERAAPAASRAAEYESRAVRAEQNGKSAVALTYWRLAAKEGSATAAERLRTLSRSSASTDDRTHRRP